MLTDNNMRALLVGRFQPFHNGHLNLVEKILEKSDSIITVIGSAQHSYTLENPFTAGERLEMISAVLKESVHKDFYIVPVEDVDSNSIWVSHIETLVPKFDVIFTNNPLVRTLFLDKGYKVESTSLHDRSDLSGTNIRKKMLKGEHWEQLVPVQISKYIKQIGGVKRIAMIAKSDKATL